MAKSGPWLSTVYDPGPCIGTKASATELVNAPSLQLLNGRAKVPDVRLWLRDESESPMRRPATKAKPAPTRAATPVMARPRLPVWLLAVLLVLVTIALYWPATRCDFVNYDDDLYVTANVQVQKGLTWESMKWACLNPVADNWHPLTVWSHMVDCQLFGLNPWGHHLTNVLLHALNAGLVFALLHTDDRRDVAESVGGGVVRRSPAARRIGGLGVGTQGCAQRLLRSARADGLRPLRAERQKAEIRRSVESEISHRGRARCRISGPRVSGLPVTDH